MRIGRTIWLIDAAYLFNGQESVSNSYAFDYLKLQNKLEMDGKIDRAYYLNCTHDPPSDRQTHFHTWLQKPKPEGPNIIPILYKLKLKEYDCPHCKMKYSLPVQKGVDVGLATLIVSLGHQHQYDNLILSSGDSDLKDAIVFMKKNLGKRLELCVFRYGIASELDSYADNIYWINDFYLEVSKEKT
ncbi:NYN domain-containing protein [Heliobacterium undosum]|uniref:NYN domain-containing protein n=1 Tax=Heliomicrobium undosum TaxID=121734 RepID=A0A845L6X3_9FIRM|nr:NYN domain-containing protein [Heliomicrobium undosum]MZP28651.1 NYN domain-containing protein [Heliomicrobium undosum]